MKKFIHTIILLAAFQFAQGQQVTDIIYYASAQNNGPLDGGTLTLYSSQNLYFPLITLIKNNGTQSINAGDSIDVRVTFNGRVINYTGGVVSGELKIDSTMTVPIDVSYSISEVIAGTNANTLCVEVVRIVYSGVSTPISKTPNCAAFTINAPSNIVGVDLKEVNLYPNPVCNHLKIENLGNATDISIYSTTGQMVRTVSSAMESVEIDMTNLSAGVYFVKMQDGKNTITKKIQVVK